MSNKGQKFLEGQNQKLRKSLGDVLKVNEEFTEINSTIMAELKEVQESTLEAYFFKALWKWFIKWRNYRKA